MTAKTALASHRAVINDIDEQIVSKILKFADDTKIYHTVQSPNDIEILQPDLHRLVEWSKDWQMLFNTDKCKVLHFGFNNPHIDYSMDGVKLQLVKEEKDLGVTVSADIKWEKQCIEAVKKANKMLGLIKKNFQDKSKETIMPLYKSLVRPHLEYCCQVWSQYLSKDINLIEGVQRKATKLIKDIKHLSYDERLENLGLSRLTTRRVRSDLIQTFKIINGIYKLDKSLFFEIDSGGRRGHSSKLFKKRSRLDIRKYAFSNRTVDKWNSLTQDCINCTTINAFKCHIQKLLEPETK